MLVTILEIILYILFGIVSLYGLYFFLTGIIGAVSNSQKPNKQSDLSTRFAIIVPARNEAGVIKNLIDSIKNSNYPSDKYEIFVIPNNCTDNTAEIARTCGATVTECKVPVKSKGDVLKYTFGLLAPRDDIDAYVIFDADNVVHRNFLTRIDAAMAKGYNVIQGFREAKNPYDNWISGSYTLFYLFQNIFFNYARVPFNGSSSINGTGFAIRKSLIDENGFETYTLTEDMEFSGQCALNKEKIFFARHAITYDEYPIGFKASWKQRKRWSAGVIECMKRYTPKLFVNFFKTGKISSLDMALVYMGPLMQLLSFAAALLAGVIELLEMRGDVFTANDALTTLISAGAAYGLGIFFEALVLAINKKKIYRLLPGIFLFFFFMLTWIPINIVCFCRRQTKWEEIKHDRNISISEIKQADSD